MPGLVNLHGNFANTTRDALFCEPSSLFYFLGVCLQNLYFFFSEPSETDELFCLLLNRLLSSSLRLILNYSFYVCGYFDCLLSVKKILVLCCFTACEPHKHIGFESWPLRLAMSVSLAPLLHSWRPGHEPKSWVFFLGLPQVSKQSHVLFPEVN